MTIEKYAKTKEEAIELALSELGVTEADVEIEVVEEGSKGFLGIGSKDACVKVTYNPGEEKRATDFLNKIFEITNEDVTVESKVEGEVLKINLSGPDMGIVIGKRGETLDAIQHLTSLNVNNNSDDFVKVSVDTENYREKRNQTLAELSKKLAVRVAKTRKNLTLEPMNSYERRIIHATLQDDKYVTTYSVGQSPNRKVVIAYNKK